MICKTPIVRVRSWAVFSPNDWLNISVEYNAIALKPQLFQRIYKNRPK